MKCPKCGGDCEQDMVDVGVGEIPCGPWGCPACHWVDPEKLNELLDDDEPKPNSPEDVGFPARGRR